MNDRGVKVVDAMRDEELSQYVSQDGSLNHADIARRDILYHGLNGRAVERVVTGQGRQFIFKPVTNGDHVDDEVAVYREVLSTFPPIVPRLLSYSEPGAGKAGWRIFEDLGQLRHEFKISTAKEVIKHMAWWHYRSAPAWSGLKSAGQKPPIADMALSLIQREEGLMRMLLNLMRIYDPGDSSELLPLFETSWRRELLTSFAEPDHLHSGSEVSPLHIQVLSHGDLHLGNYAEGEGGEIYVLDWEHAHKNTPYWDLFHLIDLSHPLFPKQLQRSERELLLREYIKYASYYGHNWEPEQFILDYCRYASVFSLWMLMLITSDLQQETPIWPHEQLKSQRQEAFLNLEACMARLLSASQGPASYKRFNA